MIEKKYGRADKKKILVKRIDSRVRETCLLKINTKKLTDIKKKEC